MSVSRTSRQRLLMILRPISATAAMKWEKKLITCTENVNLATARAGRASKRISNSVKRFCTVRTIGDVLYYAAPVAVLIDVLLRLFDFI